MWMNRKRKQVRFGVVPMERREQVDHHSDCYFCMTKISEFSRKNKPKIAYPDCQSTLKPVRHDLEYLCRSSCKNGIENEETYESRATSAKSSAHER